MCVNFIQKTYIRGITVMFVAVRLSSDCVEGESDPQTLTTEIKQQKRKHYKNT